VAVSVFCVDGLRNAWLPWRPEGAAQEVPRDALRPKRGQGVADGWAPLGVAQVDDAHRQVDGLDVLGQGAAGDAVDAGVGDGAQGGFIHVA
jgi:hypothetical protein